MTAAEIPQRRVLVLNGGSSSIKFALFEFPNGRLVAAGLAERLGTLQASLTFKTESKKSFQALGQATHATALQVIIQSLSQLGAGLSQLAGIGHRVVHGGEFFSAPSKINADVLSKIEACSRLAPLHNPANALLIRATLELFAEVPQVAVFDTAFHQTLPERAYLYAIPYRYYAEQGIRRYGFHGTSHHYVGLKAAEELRQPFATLSLLTAHLGNGCSACAIRDGKSIDTSMGLTPLEGLMMGTRSGDVDANLFSYLHSHEGLSVNQIADMLNRESGLLGVSGVSNDMRAVCEAADAGNLRAALAVELFCYRLAKALLALATGLERLDALVFTGGIGENSSRVRAMAVGHLKLLGAEIDPERNQKHGVGCGGVVSSDASALRVLVIPTNEEWMIACSTIGLI